MGKFLKGNQLISELEKIIEEAEEGIVLISPYIKLHHSYSSSLLAKKNNPELRITILFGKNEEDFSKSMKKDDFDFFKQFPNIEILFEKRLHAKYYANENKALLTSMNLYEYSQNNNIETGILMENSLKGFVTGSNSLDAETWNYFEETVLPQAEVLFLKEPKFEKKGFLSSKKNIGSEIKIDKLTEFFEGKEYKKSYKSKNIQTPKHIGYCIRTGIEITYNKEKPFCVEAFKMWNKYKDKDYTEKYCHFSGEPSNGQTSFNKPILYNNWSKAMEYEKREK